MRFALAVGWLLVAGAAHAGAAHDPAAGLPLQPARQIDIDTEHFQLLLACRVPDMGRPDSGKRTYP